jgi:large repetitive protein
VKRFALVFALVIVLAGLVVAAASALAFSDAGDFACKTPDDLVWTCPTGSVGTPYSVQFKARAGCSDPVGGGPYIKYSVSSGGLPPGLSLSSSGLLSGTPTQAGLWEPYIRVEDYLENWCGDTAHTERQFIFNVLPGLDLEPAAVPPGTVGASYSATLTVTPAGTQTFALTSGVLPPGLALGASNGVISGTPTTAGAYPFKVQVTDSEGRQIAREYNINVANPIAISPLSLQGQRAGHAEVGIALSGQLAATGGNGAFTWTVAGGTPPAGVTLGADGTISGTPSAPGTYTFTAQAADVDGRTATLAVNLTVASKLSFKTLTLRSAKVGKLYAAKLSTLGGVTPVKWKILGGTLPRGIRFAKKLGVFAGTTKRAGTYRVSVQATDALGVTAKKTFTLVVKA